jgi:hypothetical protein
MLAGVAVIGCLLVVRLRQWLRAHRTGAPRVGVPNPVALPYPVALPRPGPAAPPVDRWALLGVAGIVLLVLGESAVALAHWAGVSGSWLWPVTWLAQLTPLFFFAGGHANAAGWRGVLAAGGRYRQYLAHRASWLLRPALIFAVVALLVPVALELLGIPQGTTAAVMRIALHPLWLLGVYLLTVVATPAMLALHRRAPWAGTLVLLGVVLLGEPATQWLDSPLPRYAAALGLALLAQQAAFAHDTAGRPRPALLGGAVALGLSGLVLAVVTGQAPLTLLGTAGAPPALAAPAMPVLLLGTVQLALVGLFAERVARLGAHPALARSVRFALRAPMSLYLVFLAAMLVLVAVVYLPGRLIDGSAWTTQPRWFVAVGLLAGPAALVFWWFERHAPGHAAHPREPVTPPLVPAGPGRLEGLLGRAAVVLGIGYATLGVFGMALTRFGADSADATLAGLRADPIQSLTHLLLGVFLLHAVRIGTSAATGTWIVGAFACVPPVLAITEGPAPAPLGVALHAVTALFALAAAAGTLCRSRVAPSGAAA